jgi:hypothetical protein
MNPTEEQIILKTGNNVSIDLKKGALIYNPGLRALLAIKNLNATIEKDYIEILSLESEINILFNTGLKIIENNTSTEALDQWKKSYQDLNASILGINNTLNSAKKQIELSEKNELTELWIQLSVHLTAMKESIKLSTDLGLVLLPETIHMEWENEFVLKGTAFILALVSKVDAYRVLLQMVERYTPDELKSINQLILTKVPTDFTFEEQVDYKNDYYKALINFKTEFKEEKNLWDTFLDILAGGTHQLPAERVMMERWVEGEKGDL